jgi:hypothetical protein
MNFLTSRPSSSRKNPLWFLLASVTLFAITILWNYSTRHHFHILSFSHHRSTTSNHRKGKSQSIRNNRERFGLPTRPTLKLLSIDFHTGPISDLKDIIRRFPELGVEIIDMSLSAACSQKTCAKPDELFVLTNTRETLYLKAEKKLEFFEAYSGRKRPLTGRRRLYMNNIPIDAVICSHPAGMCELYMPFDVPIIIWSTTRFEQGHENSSEDLAIFVKNIRAIALQPENSVLANNRYDAAYLDYHIGVEPGYIPSVCAYPAATYAWPGKVLGESQPPNVRLLTRRSPKNIIPVFGYRPGVSPGPTSAFLHPINAAARNKGLPVFFRGINELYTFERRYEYKDLGLYPAVMHLPYQVSVMSFFEHYRMGIPILCPSLSFLVKLQQKMLFLSEKGWSFNRPTIVKKHEESKQEFDPNEDTEYSALKVWLGYSDFYAFPHVILFDSWEDAAEKLNSADLHDISKKMKEYVLALEQQIVLKWDAVFQKARSYWIDYPQKYLTEDLEIVNPNMFLTANERNFSRVEHWERIKKLLLPAYGMRMDEKYGKDEWEIVLKEPPSIELEG